MHISDIPTSQNAIDIPSQMFPTCDQPPMVLYP